MKGIDCTPEQIQAARDFLAQRAGLENLPGDEVKITQKIGDVVRLLAWYGALRYVAGRDGCGGTLERPGVVDVVKKARA